MNKNVILLAIDDVLKIIHEIEEKNKIEEIDNNNDKTSKKKRNNFSDENAFLYWNIY